MMITQAITTYYKCGCYYERSYDEVFDLVMINAKVCGTCFDEFHEHLSELMIDKQAQLTLDLPSATGASEASSDNS